jgi:hypothetical protein
MGCWHVASSKVSLARLVCRWLAQMLGHVNMSLSHNQRGMGDVLYPGRLVQRLLHRPVFSPTVIVE